MLFTSAASSRNKRRSSSSSSSSGGIMPRKKKSASSENHRLASVSSLTTKDKPIQRNAANARERARMRVLSRAFCRLKTTLPWVPADTKLSKLDTLRLAASYIAHLKGILREDPFGSEDPIHPAMSLTWPFGFNRGGGNGSGGGGSGSEDGESGSSCAWEEVTKDCVHLDPEDDPALELHLDATHLHHNPHLHSHPHHHQQQQQQHHHHHHPPPHQQQQQQQQHHHHLSPTNGPVYTSQTNHQHGHQQASANAITTAPCYRDDVLSVG